MIIWRDRKVSPTEVAKLLVYDKGEAGAEFFGEHFWLEGDLLTEKEVEAIGEAINKQLERVAWFLGIGKLEDRIEQRPEYKKRR